MKFSFLSVFPTLMESYFSDSIIKKAVEKELLRIELVDLKHFSQNKHNKIDQAKIGGGAGMLMEASVVREALKGISKEDCHVIFTAPAAKRFSAKDAKRLSEKKHIVFVNSRYEGVDERAIELYADEVFSIGDFILSGGELASLSMFDAIIRFVPGVLGNSVSLEEESFEEYLLEAPSFTKPLIFEKISINSEFSKGNHGRISALKTRMAEAKTSFHRPDIYRKYKIFKENI